MRKDVYKRLARIEAMVNATRAEQENVLRRGYDSAVARENAEEAAAFARRIRDRLLTESDKEVTLDRVGLNTLNLPALLLSLQNLFTGAWAVYRKQLRDLPEQDGFPFNIEWPVSPDAKEEEDSDVD